MQFTEEDLDQVLSGNFVTKVIYLPDAEFQELALAGVETLVSTRLDPGVDPIVEADRRGTILAIIRIGNKDLEIPGGAGGGALVGGGDGCDGQGGIMQTGYGAMPMACGPAGAGGSGGSGSTGRIAARLCRRHDRSAVRHADHRHADRTARSAAHSDGNSGRTASPYDQEHDQEQDSWSGQAFPDECQAGAGLQLSDSGRSRAYHRDDRHAAVLVQAAARQQVSERPRVPNCDGSAIRQTANSVTRCESTASYGAVRHRPSARR